MGSSGYILRWLDAHLSTNRFLDERLSGKGLIDLAFGKNRSMGFQDGTGSVRLRATMITEIVEVRLRVMIKVKWRMRIA
jgi:hypothetical protein